MPEPFGPRRLNKDKQDAQFFNNDEFGSVMTGTKSKLVPVGFGSANPGSAAGYPHGGSGYENEQKGFVGNVQFPAEP